LEIIQRGVTYKSQNKNSLGDPGPFRGCWLYLTVKIDFQREGCGIEHCTAIAAITKVALNFASHFRS
jgi:hypothetical protein